MSVINEIDLRAMSRNVKQLIPTDTCNSEAINKLISVVDSLFLTASSPELPASHRVASWNVLCAYIEQCSVLFDHIDSQHLPLSTDIWTRGFSLYLNYTSLARPKSCRQLLATLTAVLKRRKELGDGALLILNDAITSKLHLLVKCEDHAMVKAYATAMSHFLSKDILSIHVLLKKFGLLRPHEPDSDADVLESFLALLFAWTTEAEMASTFGTLIATLLDKQGAFRVRGGPSPVWTNALLSVTRASALDPDSLRSRLLPILFKRNVADYGAFLDCLGSSISSLPSSKFQEILCLSLQVGKDSGLLQEADVDELQVTGDAVLFPMKEVSKLLGENSRAARLTGLSLLITSPTATRPFHHATFALLKRHIPHYYADTDANFRGEVFSLMQRLLDRSRAITAVLARQAMKTTSSLAECSCPETPLNRYKRFLGWLRDFITWQLRPTASYQRHISALKCLSIICRSGIDAHIHSRFLSKSAQGNTKWPFHLCVRTAGLQRALLDLMADPFDDVRQTASTILDYFCASEGDRVSSLHYSIRQTLAKAEASMLATSRADDADGVSHLYFLLSRIAPAADNVLERLLAQLQTMLSIAEQDLQQAVERYPLHGLLTSIARVLEAGGMSAKELVASNLAVSLRRLWEIVKPILCDDAPEGFLPETVEEASGVTTKDTLSFCWRALKEASLLLGKVVVNSASYTKSPEMSLVQDLNSLCFEQLAKLRHRGAFSTVAQTWVLCCAQITSHTDKGATSGLEYWYERVMGILRTRTTINTRRSAGLPSLLCGILIADERDTLLHRAFIDLETIARQPVESLKEQESSLVQVHAMNCLKDMLKNSRLGEKSETFLPAATKLAADALQSKAWAVRNCGLMLFRGVIDRLLGTSHAHLEEESNPRKGVAPHYQSPLLEVVLGLLSKSEGSATAADVASSEGVFPALQLLQRLQLSDQHREQAVKSVKNLLGSPSWHVRDKAARTYAGLIRANEMQELAGLVQSQPCRHNAWHGRLLCARYMVARAGRHNDGVNESYDSVAAIEVLQSLLPMLVDGLAGSRSAGPIIEGAWLDIISECLCLSQKVDKDNDRKALIDAHIAKLKLDSRLRTLLEADEGMFSMGWVPRVATVRVWALALSLGAHYDEDESRSLVVDLCRRDGDTAAIFLEAMSLLIPSTSTCVLVNLWPIQKACQQILPPREISTKAKVQAQDFLLALYKSSPNANTARQDLLSDRPSRCLDTHEYVDNALQLRLLHLDSTLRPSAPAARVAEDLERLIQDLKVATSEDSDGLPFSREAAATGLAELPLTNFWRAVRAIPTIRNSLALVLYDLLHDDEEDIRLLATNCISKLQDETTEAVPPLAAHNLTPFLLSDAGNVLTRAFTDLSIDVRTSLVELSSPDTALFAEERRNLYIDAAREVHFWSRCALKLPPGSISSVSLRQLGAWTFKGLEALKMKAEKDHDGPLGWTSDADIFTLGLKVLYAAELLLCLAVRGRRIAVRPSSLRSILGEMVILSDRADFHGIWRAEIERIWKVGVVSHVRGLGTRLQSLVDEAI